MTGRAVLVTGASGFIGSHISADLLRHAYCVTAMVRRPSRDLPAEVRQAVVADIEEHEAVRAALRGMDAVVHVAGIAHRYGRGPEQHAALHRVNAGGTRALATAAFDAGVSRIVHISSASVTASGEGRRREGEAPPVSLSDYGQSKLESERVIGEICARGGLEAVILRPPLVYGPRMKGNPLRLTRLVATGAPLPLGALRHRRSMLWVGNLTQAIRCVLESPAAAGRTFHVADTEAPSMPELIRLIAEGLGKRPWLVAVPERVLGAAAASFELAGFGTVAASLSRLLEPLVLDTSAIERATGFVPATDFRAGWMETLGWYRAAMMREGGVVPS